MGYWAEFRLSPIGVVITLISYLTPVKIVAPGAVYVAGIPGWGDYGRIALAGPAVNILQALIYSTLSLASTGRIRLLSGLGATINASLALFNLLPLGEFDGSKVMRWSWKSWLSAFLLSALLYLYTLL
jgi:Zn-dependent protease